MKTIKLILILTLGLLCHWVSAQSLVQSIKGNIIDSDNQLPLIGVAVVILDSQPLIGATSDVDGFFVMPSVPIGRVDLGISLLGYENRIYKNVVVNSGKQVVINVEMEESITKLNEVVITAGRKGEALDEMSLTSVRSVSPEETNRYAGGFNDPSRLVANFAGVTNTADGGNDIIVKGNSPKYVQWKLEGMDITNPNHFGDQSGVGGSVSTLNNNMLATSDFMTGAFSAEYGNVLSAVYDVKFRNGNNQKREAIVGVGLLGVDLTLEGPIKKGYNGSYLVNYRYSTASIATDLGLIDAGGIPKFQDGAFKILLPTKKIGVFSVYGLGGKSSFLWEDVTPSTWVTPGDNFMRDDITEDYVKNANLYNIGVNHTVSLGENSYLKTNVGFSTESINDEITENVSLEDSTLVRRINFTGALTKVSYRGSTTYNQKINSKHKLQIGSRYTLQKYNIAQSQLDGTSSKRISLVSLDEGIGLVGSFINWKYRVNESLQFVTGVHKNLVLFNKKMAIEPRFAAQYKLNDKNFISLGLGQHSTMESIHNYFAQVPAESGALSTPNRDLDLLKARHLTLSLDHVFNNDLSAKFELYYQHLYDIPVENLDTSYYSTINEGLEFRYVDLVNKGTGRNYGLEFTLEKSFSKNYYYLFNASLYQSKYKSLEGIERNTQYNSNYLVNFLIGKEFPGIGRNNSNTFAINFKAFASGGKKIIPLLRDASGNIDVDQSAGQYYDFSKAYDSDLKDIYRLVVSASYKWNKPKATHELFLNLDNVTNAIARLGEYYDASAENGIGYFESFGFFPNLIYRVYF